MLKAVKNTVTLKNETESIEFPASALLGPLQDTEMDVLRKVLEVEAKLTDAKAVDAAVGNYRRLKALKSSKTPNAEEIEKVAATLKFGELNLEEAVSTSLKAVTSLLAELGTAKEDTKKDELKQQLRSYFTEQYLKVLESLGAKVHTDLVSVMVSPASLVFDLYVNTVHPPKAPLAQAVHNRTIQKMTDSLDKETVELSQDVLDAIRRPLEDENMWKNLNITGRIKVGEAVKFLELNTLAIGFYPKTLNAVVGLFVESKDAAAQ